MEGLFLVLMRTVVPTAALGAVLLVPGSLSADALPPAPGAGGGMRAPRADAPTAAELLAAVGGCVQVSRGAYRTDASAARETVPVCGKTGVVHWKADLDIDCDGRRGTHCNERTDPYFSPMTAFTQSDGRYLSAEQLPFIVVPAPSSRWRYADHGVKGGSVVAVVYRTQVLYAVVGDSGPAGVIGEASYAAAEALGIPPDPRTGGVASGVTYIVFTGTRVQPIESHRAAVIEGERQARAFVARRGTARTAPGPWG
ncbi:glycoside hydrolase family 75 protein [Streptomyces sp. NPDC005955]|uniref:glycoside hydrolase family 75 protein n=1 Tax=Streptomyces sp. NPDC005955 TaxID=3364738 RepID=UPI0036827133